MKAHAEPSTARGRATFLKLVIHHMDELSQFVRSELARHEAVGDLALGELTAHDIVDAVLLQAQRTFVKHPIPRLISRKRLIQLATEQPDAQIKRT